MKQKTAVVTGANRGIGREIARQLALRGVDVLLTARNVELAEEAARELADQGVAVRTARLDVTDEDSIVSFAGHVGTTWSSLDILVNNAGVFLDRHVGLLGLELDTLRTTMEINLYGPLRLTQALFPHLQVSGDARVVNLSSGLGAINKMGPGYVAYSISKTALNALTIKMAGELSKFGISVNSMCPGWVQTEMGGPGATRSVEQGADTAVWLALDSHGQSGRFFRDRQEIGW